MWCSTDNRGKCGSKNPEIFKRWLVEYGSDKIILGADVKRDRIAVSGWMETSEESIVPFVKKYQEAGVDYVVCTDISKDGMLRALLLRSTNHYCQHVPKSN